MHASGGSQSAVLSGTLDISTTETLTVWPWTYNEGRKRLVPHYSKIPSQKRPLGNHCINYVHDIRAAYLSCWVEGALRRNLVDTHHGIIAQTQKMQKRAVVDLKQWLA